MSNLSILTTTYFYRSIVILSIIGLIGYSIHLILNKNIWRTDENDPPEDIVKRVQARGMLSSLVSSSIVIVITFIMGYLGVSQNGIEIFVGFLFGPMFGYLLDICIGMDIGLKLLKNNVFDSIKFGLSRLANFSFIRFIVSFLLDMYIAKPFAAIFKAFSIFNLEKTTPSLFNIIDKYILQNITSIVQAIISVITFQTYSNQTRFLWAYPEPTLPKENRINSNIILIITSLASVFYLSQYAKEVKSISLHIWLSILSFVLLTGLYLIGKTEEIYIHKDEEEKIKQETYISSNSVYIGLFIFICFFMISIVYPIYNRNKIDFNETPKITTIQDIGKLMRQKITDPLCQKILFLMDQEYTK